ncbi:7193_t:CDS:2, partial [Scutellospora calospora]
DKTLKVWRCHHPDNKEGIITNSWKYISGFVLITSLLQLSTISLIAHLYNTSDRFYYGVKFDTSFMLASSSVGLNFVLACVLFFVGWMSVNRNGYENI